MPAIDDYKSSWADEVELDSGSLPPPTEVINGDFKVVTEYKIKDDKKIKVVRTYKISKVAVSKSAAKRKMLPKFGDSAKDKAGPNPHTTMVSEDVNIQIITSKEEEKSNDALLDPTKTGFAKCRFCNGEHWSVNCPFKHTASYSDKIQDTSKPSTSAGPESSGSTKTGGKYVPPFMKDSQKMGMRGGVGRDDTSAIRISNLSESMVESDLEELVKKIGPHSKMYLARDKITGVCKGFAYVHFRNRKDAANAIGILNGYGYDHLILTVEWSKPQQPQN